MAQAGASGLDGAADLGLTLTPDELPGYLRRLGIVPDGAGVTVTPLGGAVSATTSMARWTGGESWSSSPWPSSPSRTTVHATTAGDAKVRGVVNRCVFEDVGAETRPDTLRSVSLRD